jgi:glycosyltransferase involved in cell wall biosynthesis
MYSGNIGLYYDLENIVKVIGTLKNLKDVVFAFVGEGAIKKQLIDYCFKNNLDNVVFIPYQNRKGLNYSLNAADAHIVTNAKGLKGISVPSKIYGILAAGKFVIAALENGSEARNIIERCNCGKCIEPGDYVGLKNLLKDTYERKNELTCFGERGKKYSDENLEREVSIMKYRMLLYELLGSSYKLEEIKNGEYYG